MLCCYYSSVSCGASLLRFTFARCASSSSTAINQLHFSFLYTYLYTLEIETEREREREAWRKSVTQLHQQDRGHRRPTFQTLPGAPSPHIYIGVYTCTVYTLQYTWCTCKYCSALLLIRSGGLELHFHLGCVTILSTRRTHQLGGHRETRVRKWNIIL